MSRMESVKGQHKTRKDALEYILTEIGELPEHGAAQAWTTLIEWLTDLSHPETRNPRYNHLMKAIYMSGLRGKKLYPLPGASLHAGQPINRS